MDITTAGIGDAADLSQLCRHVQGWHARAFPDLFKSDPDPAALTAFFTDRLAEPDNTFFVAHRGGVASGYLWVGLRVRPDGLFHHHRRDAHIEHICVAPHARRSGLGRTLMQRAKEFAVTKDCSAIQLDTYALNTDAQAFFVSQGFAVHRLLYRAIAE